VPSKDYEKETGIKPVLSQEEEAGDQMDGPQELTADQFNGKFHFKPEKSGDSLNPNPVSHYLQRPHLTNLLPSHQLH
jgi:hypothetical protein